MKLFKQKIFVSLKMIMLAMLVFQLSFSNFSFAVGGEKPDICSGPSETMELYFEFQEEMAQTLAGGILGEKIFNMRISSVGLFTSKVLKLPAPFLIAMTLLQSSVRFGKALANSTFLIALSAVSVVSSNLEGLVMFFQDRPIVRDFKRLLEIETKITQVSFHLGTQVRMLTASLDAEGQKKLYWIIKKYEDLGLFENLGQEDNDVSYADILESLMILNANMKLFITTGFFGVGSFAEYDGFFGAELSAKAKAQLKNEYAGLWSALGFGKCNDTREDTWHAIKSASSIGTHMMSALKTIGISTLKLLRAMGEFPVEVAGFSAGNFDEGIGGRMFDETELQMLRSIYGVDVFQMTTYELGRLSNLVAPQGGWKNAWMQVKKRASSLFEAVKGNGSTRNSLSYQNGNNQSNWTELPDEVRNFSELSEEERMKYFWSEGYLYSDKFNDDLLSGFQTTFDDAESMGYELREHAIAVETTVQTPMFKAITDQIDELDKVIGDKSSGIRDAVGKLCEYQASNKGNQGCRP